MAGWFFFASDRNKENEGWETDLADQIIIKLVFYSNKENRGFFEEDGTEVGDNKFP